jgi:hypothetical protein
MAYEFPSGGNPPLTHRCVVYDPGDGEVLHLHQFFGGSSDPDECARIALQTLESVRAVQSQDLRVLHIPQDAEIPSGSKLRVDLATNNLVSEPPDPLRGAG